MSDKKTLPDKCAVTRDLMPLCIDGTASDASQRRVDKHVAGCDPCAMVYREMQTQIELDVPDQQEAEQFDTAVKKVRHKHAWRKLRNVLMGVVLALAVCAGLAYGYYWYFVEEVPLPIDVYKMDLAMNTSSSRANPVVIRTENMPKPAKLHIEVRTDGTVMDAQQQTRPNRKMYIWATVTRSTDLDACGYSDYNYYGFDKVAWATDETWVINGREYQIDTVYKGAPEAEQTLLYKPEIKESLDWVTGEYVLHAVSSIRVEDDEERFVAFVTPVPTLIPSLTATVATPVPTFAPIPITTAVPADLLLYYNTLDQAIFYHVDPMCSSMDSAYLPLDGKVQYGELNNEFYISLQACPHCGAPQRSWGN